MKWSSIERGWQEYQATAKQKWTKIPDDQMEGTMGKREQLSMHVQEAYALSRPDAERQISDWQARQVEKKDPAA